MKKWIITTPVVSAKGFQKWSATAETKEAALAIFESGEAEFVAEEIEVTHTGEPDIQPEDE